MASRTDLLQSYQFRTRRVLAALVMRETDPSQSPLRRGVGAVFAGLMITILAGAGFGIYGLISKVGGDSWRTPGAVVVERETGATYVYLNDTLYPTLNLASAMLAAGQANPTVHRVASKSLADVARGNPIGIPGAPDSLPGADRKIGLPWTVCARTQPDAAGQRVPQVALAVGLASTGGNRLADNAVLVRDAQRDQTYLVWHGRRYPIGSPRTVVPALFRAATPVDVGPAWLNALPSGTTIAPVQVDGRGAPSKTVPGYHNGDVLRLATASGTQYYLVRDDGLAPLTAVQYAASNSQTSAPIDITSSVVGDVPVLAGPPAADTDPPATPPALMTVGPAEAICATTTAVAGAPWITVGATVAGLERATPTRGTTALGAPLANFVLVPAGRVAVVRAVDVADSPSGSYVVVTDLGIGFPVPGASVLPLLGYSTAQAVDVPDRLVALVPAGPSLDPAAAAAPVTTP